MSKRYLKSVPVSPDNPTVEKGEDICTNCSHRLAVRVGEIGVAQLCKVTGANGFTCIHCGRCAAAYPERTIHTESQWQRAAMAADGQQKIVISSTASSVRVGPRECFGGKPGDFVENYMVSVLRKLGADFVLNMAFSAGLAIMEEETEFLKRFIVDSHPLPQFTNCCPAWVKYIETFYPERIPRLFSTKSPISMRGTLIRTHFSEEKGTNLRRIASIVVAPCTAKRFEISWEKLYSTGTYLGIPGLRNNDYILTTRELAEWIREAGIGFYDLTPPVFDSLIGEGSGAEVIFGDTGGVMEAALRMAYSVVNGTELPDLLIQYQPTRGLEQVRESVVSLGGRDVCTAVVYNTRAAERLIATGAVDDYDFMEVITCPDGYISGGGQPDNGMLPVPDQFRMARIRSLYLTDQKRSFGNSLENQEIKHLYEIFIGEPMNKMAQLLLHTNYHSRKRGI